MWLLRLYDAYRRITGWREPARSAREQRETERENEKY